jgi:hypothetical protein
MRKISLILTALASLTMANAFADPPRSDAEIAAIAKKCGISFKFAREALAAGFHYNPVDNFARRRSVEPQYNKTPGLSPFAPSGHALNPAASSKGALYWVFRSIYDYQSTHYQSGD